MKQVRQNSPFSSLEKHFLNVFHAGVYISGQELLDIAKSLNYDFALKSRELLLKNLFNTAHDKGDLEKVFLALTHIIEKRVTTLNTLCESYPKSSFYLKNIIQRSKSSELLIKQQQRANPYE